VASISAPAAPAWGSSRKRGGEILEPLSLALIAGSSNILSPQATANAVLPAYLFLAFCIALVALSFLFLGVETHGKAIAFVGEDGHPPDRTSPLDTKAH
jgi:MFS transporter, putative metabolite:H+ symporter